MALEGSLRNLVLLVIIDIIVLSVVGSVAGAVYDAAHSSGITGTAAATIVNLITMLYIVCIVGANIAVLYKMFKTGD